MNLSAGKILLILILVVPMTGCKKNIALSDRQTILFEYEYINYTMSYQHYGFIIDYEGNVLTYRNPENWNYPDRENRISETQIAENLTKCTHSGLTVPKSELLGYSSHIKNIASSKVTALRNVADNEGSTQFICYQFSDGSGMYKRTIIKMEGDFTCENLNFFSRKAAEWMKKINSSLPVR